MSEFTETLEQIINNDARLAGLFQPRREIRWRYFSVRGDEHMFAWSTERDAKGKFSSWIWKPVKAGHKRTKTVSHSKRKAAKARALRLRDEATSGLASRRR